MRFIIDYRDVKVSDCNDIVYAEPMFSKCKVVEYDRETYTIIFMALPDYHNITKTENDGLNTICLIVKGDIADLIKDSMISTGCFVISNYIFAGFMNMSESDIFGSDPVGIPKLIDEYKKTFAGTEAIKEDNYESS